MKKNGFTLIELLGVIVILSIISLITIPIIDSSLNKGKDNLSVAQKKQVIKALKDYYADHLSEFNLVSEEACKGVTELQNLGYLPADIKDPKTNEEYTSFSVCVKKTGNKYTYDIKKGD